MKVILSDIETDGLLDQLSTIHCLVNKDATTGEVTSATDHLAEYKPGSLVAKTATVEDGLKQLMEADVIIFHNGIAFDIPAIQKLYPWFKPKGLVRDTLVLSRLFYSDMKEADFTQRRKLEKKGKEWIPGQFIGRHSLESWGYRLGEWKGDYAKEREKEAKAKGIPKSEIVNFVWGTWNQAMQDYCVQDVEVTSQLWEKFLKKAEEWGIDMFDANPEPGTDCIQLEHQVAAIMFRQEQYGVGFDEKKASKLYSHLIKRRDELETELQKVFKPWFRNRGRQVPKATRSVKRTNLDIRITKRRFSEKTGKELKPYVGPVKEHYEEGAAFTRIEMKEFNPGSRDDIADRLIKLRGWKPSEFTKDGKPKCSEEVLEQLDYPEVKPLNEYLMVCKRLGQLASGDKAWLKNLRPDGRISAQVISNGTVTGRMTHRGVANVPALFDKKTGDPLPYGKECRELFTSTILKGMVMVGCDADGLELRVLGGYMARWDGGEYIKTILDGDKSKGTDMHSRNASALGLFRETAKTWFYAFIYGAGFWKLGWEANIRGTQQEIIAAGKKLQGNFLKGFPALAKLIKMVKKRAQKRGYIKGLDGRRISVRKLNAALNTLLQSAGAILMKRALVLLDEHLHANFNVGEDCEFMINYHDEFQIDAKEKIAEQVKAAAEWSIEEAGKFYDFRCPLSGSGDIGLNWKETH